MTKKFEIDNERLKKKILEEPDDCNECGAGDISALYRVFAQIEAEKKEKKDD